MSRAIPTINTQRVTLRGMRPEDFDRFADIWSDRRVVTHITGSPRPRAQSWDAFLRNAGHWQIAGFGQWAIQLHGQPEMSGQVGFFFGARDQGDDFDRYPEAGWVLSPEAQGRGLGLEATKAAHDWFDRIVAGPLVCMITPFNTASLGLAEALGYVHMRDALVGGDVVALMKRKGPPV